MCVGLLLIAGSVRADVMRLYDGDGQGPKLNPFAQAGVTYRWFNRAAWIRWENEGGDWQDASGARQGDVPFARVRVGGRPGTDLSLDVTALAAAEGIVLRQTGDATVQLASRESDTPPVLTVTTADGRSLNLLPTADATLVPSTAKGTGKSRVLNPAQTVVMQFPELPAQVVKATLRLSVVRAVGSGELRAYALRVPRHALAPATPGYAANYPLDRGIEKDPRTLYAEDWENPKDWWRKNGSGRKSARTSWAQDGGLFPTRSFAGMWLANGDGQVPAQCTTSEVPRGTGYIGNGLMGVHCPDILAEGVEVPTVHLRGLGGERDEVWARYYIKYGANHLHFARCEGGKAPGLAGNTSVAGNSGRPGWGIRGWSMRNQFQFVCDPENPAYRRIVFGIYAYDGEHLDSLYGSMWGGQEHSLLETDRWYCIEQRVKVNTPGVNDGIVQLFIDGRLVVNKDKVLLRSVKPAEGYGRWELVSKNKRPPAGKPVYTDHRGATYWLRGPTIEGDLGVAKFWGMVHGGGVTPTGVSGQFWYDQTVVATERIGCAVAAAKP